MKGLNVKQWFLTGRGDCVPQKTFGNVWTLERVGVTVSIGWRPEKLLNILL